MRLSAIGNLSKFLLAVSSFSDLIQLFSLGTEPSLLPFTYATPYNALTSFRNEHNENISLEAQHVKRMVEYDPPRRHDHRRNPHYHPHFRHPHLHPAYGGTSEHDEHDTSKSGTEGAGHETQEGSGDPSGHDTGDGHQADHSEPSSGSPTHSPTTTPTFLSETTSISSHTRNNYATAQTSGSDHLVHYSTVDLTTTITLTPTVIDISQAEATHTRLDDQYAVPRSLEQSKLARNVAKEKIHLAKKAKEKKMIPCVMKHKQARTVNPDRIVASKRSNSDRNESSMNQEQGLGIGLPARGPSDPNKLEVQGRASRPVLRDLPLKPALTGFIDRSVIEKGHSGGPMGEPRVRRKRQFLQFAHYWEDEGGDELD